MKFLVLFALLAGAFASSKDCPANSHYEECGTACPKTCGNYNDSPKACVLICVSDCFCDEGYVKNEDGECVKPHQCSSEAPQVCGENMHYNECGVACPLTCENYDNPPRICPAMCVIGCECDKGFVRRNDGKCVKPAQCPNRQAALDRPDCDKAPETGLCRARIPRYYYDQDAGQCKMFIYGGCGGNRNNFKTEDECYNKCGALHYMSREICNLEAETGPCFAAFRRYFFNKNTGSCEKFIYGGCQGNENNFHSQQDCENHCLV